MPRPRFFAHSLRGDPGGWHPCVAPNGPGGQHVSRPRLIVCTTCRAGQPLAEGETPPGAHLHAALAALIAEGDAGVELARGRLHGQLRARLLRGARHAR